VYQIFKYTFNLSMINKNKKAFQIILIGIVFSFLLFLLPWLKWEGLGENPNVKMIDGLVELFQKGKTISLVICSLNILLPIIFAIEFSRWKELTTRQKQLFFLFILAIAILGFWHIHIEMLIYNFGKVDYHFHIGYVFYLLSVFLIPMVSFSLIEMNKENENHF